MHDIVKYSVTLALIGAIASGFLAGVNALTYGKIREQALVEQNESLSYVMPQAVRFEAVGAPESAAYYRAFDAAGAYIGAAFLAHGKGYASVIETMVGMYCDGTIAAIKIINQNETPGLGTRIKEVDDEVTLGAVLRGKKLSTKKIPWFQKKFFGKQINEVAEVQAISGATISSTAVIKAVENKGKEMYILLQSDGCGPGAARGQVPKV